MRKSLILALIIAPVGAYANDTAGEIANRLAGDLQIVADDMVRKYQEFEAGTGGIPLPGGDSIKMDDILSKGLVELARSLIGSADQITSMMIGGQGKRESVSSSSDLPRFPVDEICRKTASGAVDVFGTYDACLGKEQVAYDVIALSWRNYPENLRSSCSIVAGIRGQSYVALEACLGPVPAPDRAGNFRY